MVGFEPTIAAGERPQNYALDRAATFYLSLNVFHLFRWNIIIVSINPEHIDTCVSSWYEFKNSDSRNLGFCIGTHVWIAISTFIIVELVMGKYTRVNKNPSAWNFLSPKPEVTCGTVAVIIRVVLLSPYLRIRAVSLSSIHYNQSHCVYINRRRQYICFIWN